MELRPEEITKIIRSQIKNYQNTLQTDETGIVLLVGDGIARVSGLSGCMAGELLVSPTVPTVWRKIWRKNQWPW